MFEKDFTRKEFLALLGGLVVLIGVKSIPSQLVEKVVDKTKKRGPLGYGTDTYGGTKA